MYHTPLMLLGTEQLGLVFAEPTQGADRDPAGGVDVGDR